MPTYLAQPPGLPALISQDNAGVDANAVASGTALDVGGLRNAILEVVAVSGTHATHVIKLQSSVDKVTWVDDVSVTGTGSATGTVNHRHVRYSVTTAEGAASSVDVKWTVKP